MEAGRLVEDSSGLQAGELQEHGLDYQVGDGLLSQTAGEALLIPAHRGVDVDLGLTTLTGVDGGHSEGLPASFNVLEVGGWRYHHLPGTGDHPALSQSAQKEDQTRRDPLLQDETLDSLDEVLAVVHPDHEDPAQAAFRVLHAWGYVFVGSNSCALVIG